MLQNPASIIVNPGSSQSEVEIKASQSRKYGKIFLELEKLKSEKVAVIAEDLDDVVVPVKISGWQKESKSGKKFLSLSYSPDYKTMLAARDAKEAAELTDTQEIMQHQQNIPQVSGQHEQHEQLCAARARSDGGRGACASSFLSAPRP